MRNASSNDEAFLYNKLSLQLRLRHLNVFSGSHHKGFYLRNVILKQVQNDDPVTFKPQQQLI